MNIVVLLSALAAAASPAAAVAPCQTEYERTASPDRAEQAGAPTAPTAQAPRPAAAQRADQTVQRPDAPRRRNGKGVPDAELIGPRGAL